MARYPVLHSSLIGGAGHISALTGGLLDILDKVLVDGYGTTASLGWSSPFPRFQDVACYLPAAGTQQTYRFDDAMVAVGFKVAGIKAFESMSDLDNGLGNWGNMYFGKVSSGVLHHWWIWGDDRGFYMIIADYESYVDDVNRGIPVIIQYIGDFDSLVVGDVHNAMVLGHTSSTILPSAAGSSFFKNSGANNTTGIGKVYGNNAGTVLDKAVIMSAFDGGRPLGASNSTYLANALQSGDPIPRLQQITIGNTEGLYSARGKVPGLHNVWPNITARTGDTFKNAAGDDFMIFNVKLSSGWTQYALQTNVW